MSLIRFNKRFPWFNSNDPELMHREDLFRDDWFRDDFWDMAIQRTPALNVRETEDEYEIELAVPGLSKEDLKVSVDDGYLNISAERQETKEEKETHYTRKEFNFNSFRRSLLLPEGVMEDRIKATYDNGILHLNLTKKEEAKWHASRPVEVH